MTAPASAPVLSAGRCSNLTSRLADNVSSRTVSVKSQDFTDDVSKRTISVMSSRGEYVDVDEAARMLGVTKRHVARLGEQGQIRYLTRGTVDRGSVTEYLSERESSRSRPWSEATAWGAIAMLSGIQVDWLGQVQASRLRGRLRRLATDDNGAHELVGRARLRASVRTYESFSFLTSRVRKDLVVVGRRGLGLSDARKDRIDGYVNADVLTKLERDLGLHRDTRGTMILRATHFDLDPIKRIATKGNGALAALDAAGSMDPRERGVGARALTKYLEDFARG